MHLGSSSLKLEQPISLWGNLGMGHLDSLDLMGFNGIFMGLQPSTIRIYWDFSWILDSLWIALPEKSQPETMVFSTKYEAFLRQIPVNNSDEWMDGQQGERFWARGWC